MAARNSLAKAGVIAAAVMVFAAALFTRISHRRSAAPRAVPSPTATRSIAIAPVIPAHTRSAGEALAGIAGDVAARLRGVEGVRVVAATIPAGTKLNELRALLNVAAVLEVRAVPDDKIEVALRDRDSTILTRSYAAPSGALSATTNAMALDAANALRAQIGLPRLRALGVPATDVAPLIARGDSLAESGNVAEAERVYLAAISGDRQSSAARDRYATLLASRRRLNEALREARRAHELDPLSPGIHARYAQMLARLGRTAESTHEMEELRRIAAILQPTPKDSIARSRFNNVPKRPPRPPRRSTPRRG